jgi:hypothetical protein
MKNHRIRIITIILLVIAILLACSISQPTPVSQPTLEPSLAPSNTPAPTPTETLIPVLPTAKQPVSRLYGVALLLPGQTANIRSAPGQDSLIIGTLRMESGMLSSTGSTAEADGLHWIEIAWAQNKTGWVSSLYLTEYTPQGAFCSDNRIPALLAELKTALLNQDGDAFAALVSPTRGLSVKLLMGGNWANYTPEQVSWLFKSSYQYNWGRSPASGLDVVGSFPEKIQPLLTQVFSTDYVLGCNRILLDDISYHLAWPEYYEAFNYYSVHLPAPAEEEPGWRIWLTGIEYIEGQPYLMSLVNFDWEP